MTTTHKTKMTFDFINNKTGFANGEQFKNRREVRSYFTRNNMFEMFGELDISKQALAEMATLVIERRWHCDFSDWDTVID